jgi:hypothetical protein
VVVVVVVVRVDVAEDGRDVGVVVVRVVMVVVRAVARVVGVILAVAVAALLRTAPPGVVRAVGLGVPGFTEEVAGEALVEADVAVLVAGAAFAAVAGVVFVPLGVNLECAAIPAIRGAGLTGAFLVAVAPSTVGGTISEMISSSLG